MALLVLDTYEVEVDFTDGLREKGLTRAWWLFVAFPMTVALLAAAMYSN